MKIRLTNDPTYVADHANDNDGNDSDGDGSDEDPDAVLLLKDNDLSFQLQTGTLVANYNDSNNNNVTDYEEMGTDSDIDPDLYEMTLNVPRINKTGASVTLSIPYAFFNVYTTQSKDQFLSAIVPDAVEGSGVYTWNGNAADIPHTIWLEVKQGSQSVNDVVCDLNSNDNGASPPGFDQKNTAVNFKLDALTDPNQEGIWDVKNKKRKWLIGQLVDQIVEVQAPAAWKTNLAYQWSVPGNILRSYDMTASAATPFGVTDDDGGQPFPAQHTGYKQAEIRFFWVSTAAEGAMDQDTVSVHITNVNGQNYDVSSNYQVNTPTVSATATLGTAGIDPNVPEAGLILPPAGEVGGINYHGSVRTPTGFASGTWNFLQTIQPRRSHLDAGSNPFHWSINGLWGLDTALQKKVTNGDPYNSGNAWIANGGAHQTNDNPGESLVGLTKDLIDDKFYTFVMFQPPGDGSYRVPLRVLGWDYHITAVLTNNGAWGIQGTPGESMDPPSGIFKRETAEPTWTRLNTSDAPLIPGW